MTGVLRLSCVVADPITVRTTDEPEVRKLNRLGLWPTLRSWWAGRESNPDLQLRTLPYCSVTLPNLLELAPGVQPGSLRQDRSVIVLWTTRAKLNLEGMQRIEL